MTETVSATYRRLVDSGELDFDPAQAQAALALDELANACRAHSTVRTSWMQMFFKPSPAPKGLYMHGHVGRGKTMLMDMFYESVAVSQRRRAHFHEFMADVHERIADARQHVPGDPIPTVARAIAKQARLLCFDEFHVTDIADAMILGRLFETLFAENVVIVATSNAAPRELYRNGLNRDLFLPFIDLLGRQMTILELDAAKDFRMEKLAGQQLYFTPLNDGAEIALDGHWTRLTGGHQPQSGFLDVKGRELPVPMSAMGVARFDFDALCEQPLGAQDYLHIAHAFHTIILAGIPKLGPERRNAARRFIILIDTLYDNRTTLIASAAAEPADLYPAGSGADLFERTVSRLIEMRSADYLADREERRTRASAS